MSEGLPIGGSSSLNPAGYTHWPVRCHSLKVCHYFYNLFLVKTVQFLGSYIFWLCFLNNIFQLLSYILELGQYWIQSDYRYLQLGLSVRLGVITPSLIRDRIYSLQDDLINSSDSLLWVQVWRWSAWLAERRSWTAGSGLWSPGTRSWSPSQWRICTSWKATYRTEVCSPCSPHGTSSISTYTIPASLGRE